MGDQQSWTGSWDETASRVEQLLLAHGFSVHTGPGILESDTPNGITVVLAEEDGLVNAYRDMDRNFEADPASLGTLSLQPGTLSLQPVAVYNPQTDTLTVNSQGSAVAQR